MTTAIQTTKKRGRKIMVVFGIILAVIVVLLSASAILHATYYKAKLDSLQPYGQLIDVYDGKMHVKSAGAGSQTIVLLPGMGVSLPSADFGPLMRELGKHHTVVCLEYFGVGFSSQTDRPRTVENYVEEIRAALSAVGFKAPYVLMPHSISSVYSEYYAAKYPDEVQAILSLDGTSTAYVGEDMPGFVKSLLAVAQVQQGIGVSSVLAPLVTNRAQLRSIGYTEKEIDDMLSFAGFVMNKNTLEQMGNTTDHIKQTKALDYPQTVPYFKVISRKTYETPNAQLKITPQEYQKQHLERLGSAAQYEILEGTHFIYSNNATRIAEIVDDFLTQTEMQNAGADHESAPGIMQTINIFCRRA